MNESGKRIAGGPPEESEAVSQPLWKPKHSVWLSLVVTTAAFPCAFVLGVFSFFLVGLLYLITFNPYGHGSEEHWLSLNLILAAVSACISFWVYRRFRWGKVATSRTPLHTAAAEGCKDVVELLLASRANVNAQDNDGHTPLHAAAITDHNDVVELLLNHQAAVNAKNNQGETPSKMAVNRNHQAVAELLRQHGGHE